MPSGAGWLAEVAESHGCQQVHTRLDAHPTRGGIAHWEALADLGYGQTFSARTAQLIEKFALRTTRPHVAYIELWQLDET